MLLISSGVGHSGLPVLFGLKPDRLAYDRRQPSARTALTQSSLTKLKGAANVYTFREFILLPGRSELEPREIDLATRLTGKIKLSIPVVSSPMDTVTEWKMAVALARVGGVGVVHR